MQDVPGAARPTNQPMPDVNPCIFTVRHVRFGGARAWIIHNACQGAGFDTDFILSYLLKKAFISQNEFALRLQ